jgi:hypothetical protein
MSHFYYRGGYATLSENQFSGALKIFFSKTIKSYKTHDLKAHAEQLLSPYLMFRYWILSFCINSPKKIMFRPLNILK